MTNQIMTFENGDEKIELSKVSEHVGKYVVTLTHKVNAEGHEEVTRFCSSNIDKAIDVFELLTHRWIS